HSTCITLNMRISTGDASMANDEHVALLKQGVDAWNAWREENPDIRPDLSGADLGGANLGGANLSGADLSGADLTGARAYIDRSDWHLSDPEYQKWASLIGGPDEPPFA